MKSIISLALVVASLNAQTPSEFQGAWNVLRFSVPDDQPIVASGWTAQRNLVRIGPNGELTDITVDPSAEPSGTLIELDTGVLLESPLAKAIVAANANGSILSGIFSDNPDAATAMLALKAPPAIQESNLADSTWTLIEYRYPTTVETTDDVVTSASSTPTVAVGELAIDATGAVTINLAGESFTGTTAIGGGPGEALLSVTIPGEGTLNANIFFNQGFDVFAWVDSDPEDQALFIGLRVPSRLNTMSLQGIWDVAGFEVPSEDAFFQAQAAGDYDQSVGYAYLRGDGSGYAVVETPVTFTFSLLPGSDGVSIKPSGDDALPLYLNRSRTFGVSAAVSADGENSILMLSRREPLPAIALIRGIDIARNQARSGYDLTFEIESAPDLENFSSVLSQTVEVPAQGPRQFLRLLVNPQLGGTGGPPDGPPARE